MLDAEILLCASSRELAWVNVCLRSVQRFWKGAYPPILVVPPECRNNLPSIVQELRCTLILKPVEQHAYIRMTIDCYMCAPMVLFLDVRAMFTHECSVSTFTDPVGHKPILAFESFAEAVRRPGADANCVIVQKDTADDLLDTDSPYDYTARGPILFYRHSIRRVRELIESKNKRTMAFLMQNYCPEYFSYQNVIGAHVWSKERLAYQMVPVNLCDTLPVHRFNGVADPTKGEDLQEVQRILA